MSEKVVMRIIGAFKDLINPFSLVSIASGAPPTEQVKHDVLLAEDIGEKTANTFIEERMQQH